MSNQASNQNDLKNRLAKLNTINDQDELAEIANTDNNEQVRLAAVKRINLQPVLARVAKTATDAEVRREAILHLNDQQVLGDIARHDPDPAICYCAARHLDDRSLGELYAETQYYNEIIRWTLYKVKDKEVLTKVAENTSNNVLRGIAKKKLAKMSGE